MKSSNWTTLDESKKDASLRGIRGGMVSEALYSAELEAVEITFVSMAASKAKVRSLLTSPTGTEIFQVLLLGTEELARILSGLPENVRQSIVERAGSGKRSLPPAQKAAVS